MKTTSLIILFAITLILTNSCTNTEHNLYSTIYGCIIDAGTSKPIPSVNVTLSPGGKGIISGSNGQYEFSDLDIMQYTIMVQKEGYQSNRKLVTAISGEKVKADIIMKKSE